MTELTGRFQLASSDVVCEEFDGELVVLNLASGLYFALNPSASCLFNGLIQGCRIEQLASIDGVAWSRQDAEQFFRRLVEHQLICKADSAAAAELDAATLEWARSCSEKPCCEDHNDLADLIIADPIHDADESAGWPLKKAA